MYIGPWQEYKLARLIQHHQELQQTPQSTPQSRRPLSQPRRPPARAPRRTRSDDTASVCSSESQSGFSFQSTQSAPAAPSPQSRLNNFYDHLERNTRQETVGSRQAGRPPRPFSSAGSRGGARGQGGGKRSSSRPGAKAKAKARQAQSLDDTRRARILHMQRLYGLASDEEELPPAAPSPVVEPTVDTAASVIQHEVSPLQHVASLPVAPKADADSFTPDFDRALSELRASMVLHEEVPDSFNLESNLDDDRDPMGLSLTAGSSGGLIAWSKNLKPEELSSEVTLESLLRPL
mmetsp:Transcript_68916/g.131368  ORF Transcript_68916/g.131368 Transcript_68916/m.131368 type:complete len:292 (-) Transcript_68916:45-920(-)